MFGNVDRKKKILLKELLFYVLEEEKALGVEEKMKEEVVSELERSTLMEEASLRQNIGCSG